MSGNDYADEIEGKAYSSGYCPPGPVEDNQPRQRRVTKPRNGRTIVQALLEELWRELDTIVELIMSEGEPYFPGAERTRTESWKQQAEAWQQYGEWRGQAQGLAYALAVLTNPYQPDVDAIRKEAMQRWEAGENE